MPWLFLRHYSWEPGNIIILHNTPIFVSHNIEPELEIQIDNDRLWCNPLNTDVTWD